MLFNIDRPRRNRLSCIVFAAVCAAGGTLAAQTYKAAETDPSARPGSGDMRASRLASCILRIPGDDSIIPLEKEFVESVMLTSAVRSEAVRSVLGRDGVELLEVDQIRTELEVIAGPQLLGNNLSPTFFRLTVRVDEVDSYGERIRPAAEEIQAAIVENLRRALVHLSEQNAVSVRESIARSEQRLSHATKRLETLREQRNEMASAAGRMSLNRDNVLEEIAQFEAQLRDVEIERVSQHARQSAIESHISRTVEARSMRADEDAILAELKHLADIKAAQLERIEKLANNQSISQSEVQEARASLIEAKIRVQDRLESVARELRGGEIDSLNMELADISIATIESDARTAVVRDRLEKLARQLEMADRLEVTVGLAMPAALEAVRVETERLQELRSQFETFRPVTVDIVGQLDGDASSEKTR